MMNPDHTPREEDRPVAVDFSDGMLRVMLHDGRMIATPLDWYPRLANATPEQRQTFELSGAGIHWEALDEDLSVDGMLHGIHPRPLTVKA